MNTDRALAIAARAAELTRLVTLFQVKYGQYPAVTPELPAEAHRLQTAIFNKQLAIARLLDPDALAKPLLPLACWWQRQAVPAVTAAGELAREANHLIACCAFQEAAPVSGEFWDVADAQAAIAGLLHPDARRAASPRPRDNIRLDRIISWN
mgnify:CR=1 FL=1